VATIPHGDDIKKTPGQIMLQAKKAVLILRSFRHWWFFVGGKKIDVETELFMAGFCGDWRSGVI
jgi:hypothetical protein